jgi:hypothetical protein
MFRLDVRAPVVARLVACEENDAACFCCEAFKHEGLNGLPRPTLNKTLDIFPPEAPATIHLDSVDLAVLD